MLGGPVAERLRELIARACEVYRWQAHELSIQRDHVHLLLQVGPNDSVSSVMQALQN